MEPAPSELLGIDQVTGKSPVTRVKDGASGRALVQRVVKDDNIRAQARAIVKGMVDGNPPYNDAKRKANGLGWTANLNLMGLKGIMDSSGVPYYQIFNGVQHYAETRTAYQPDNPDHELWHGLIANRFHQLLKRWPQFDWNMQQASYQMRLHGIGPCFFDRDGDWRFRSIASGNVLVPQGSASCLDARLKYVVVRVTYTVMELWERIKDEASAKAVGWDVEAVKSAIKFAGRGMFPGESWRTGSWEKWQEMLKNNDLYTSTSKSDELACAHLLVQEFGGKTSHFLVTESEVIDDSIRDDKDAGFLFKHPNRYDGYEQALAVFFQDIGDGTWHSVRGLAALAFKHEDVLNRLYCRTIDGAMIESSLVLQPGTAKNADKLQLMQIGPVTYVPAGAEIRQTKLSGFLDGPMAVARMLGNHLANNIGMFQQRTLSREDGRGETPTATQINAQVAKESTLSQGQMTLFYLTLDRLYWEMFRRASESSDAEAKRFRKECKEDGVPLEALKNMECVRANREGGYGSPQMRQLTDQQMMPLVSMLPEEGRQNFLEDMVGGIKGSEKVRRYVPKQHVADQDDSIAAIENAMMAAGREPVIASGQNDAVHMESHLKDAADTLEPLAAALENGESDPAALQQAYAYVSILAPHATAHLARLRADPTRRGMVALFEDQLSNVVAFHGKLRGALISAQREAEIAAEQEQQATALGALDEAKLRQVDTQTRLDEMKTMSHIENQRTKVLNQLRLGQIKTAEHIRQQRARELAA